MSKDQHTDQTLLQGPSSSHLNIPLETNTGLCSHDTFSSSHSDESLFAAYTSESILVGTANCQYHAHDVFGHVELPMEGITAY